MMNQRTLDVLVPMLFALAMMLALFVFDGGIIPVAVIGGIVVGIYFAALRQNLPAGNDG